MKEKRKTIQGRRKRKKKQERNAATEHTKTYDKKYN